MVEKSVTVNDKRSSLGNARNQGERSRREQRVDSNGYHNKENEKAKITTTTTTTATATTIDTEANSDSINNTPSKSSSLLPHIPLNDLISLSMLNKYMDLAKEYNELATEYNEIANDCSQLINEYRELFKKCKELVNTESTMTDDKTETVNLIGTSIFFVF
jgi:hypothetical protein